MGKYRMGRKQGMLNDDQPPSTFLPSFLPILLLLPPPPVPTPLLSQRSERENQLQSTTSPVEKERKGLRLTSVGQRSEGLNDDRRLLGVVKSIDLRRVGRRGGHR